MNILEINTDIDLLNLSSRVLRNEKKILKNYSPTDYFKSITDGGTGLGTNSLTSRYYHFNVLSWFGTRKLKKYIRRGYDQYNSVKNAPAYVQCWANVMRKGDIIKAHKHMDLNLSHLQALSGHLCVKVDGSTNTYYERTPIQNKNGQMILFPSTLLHWTDRYIGNKERITIAFDIYSKKLYDNNLFEDAKKHWIKL